MLTSGIRRADRIYTYLHIAISAKNDWGLQCAVLAHLESFFTRVEIYVAEMIEVECSDDCTGACWLRHQIMVAMAAVDQGILKMIHMILVTAL